MRTGTIQTIGASLLMVSWPLVAKAQTYSITEIGTFGGASSSARGISSSGLVTGWAHQSNGLQRAFLFDGSDMIDLGALPGQQESQGSGVNDAGQVVGWYSPGARAFFWQNGIMIDADPLSDGVASYANAINNAGVFVGALSRPGVYAGGVWSVAAPASPSMKSPPWGGKCSPFLSLAGNGVAAGDAWTGSNCVQGQDRGTTFDGSAWTLLAGIDNKDARVWGLNDKGQAIGQYEIAPGVTMPVRWVGEVPVELGTLGGPSGRANGINDAEYIIGTSKDASGKDRATLWHAGQVIDLNDRVVNGTGLTLTVARAINGTGTIVGDATDASGNTVGFIAQICYANCDDDSALSIDDFICFQTFFALGDPYADCDADGGLSIDDFICFQTLFAIGC